MRFDSKSVPNGSTIEVLANSRDWIPARVEWFEDGSARLRSDHWSLTFSRDGLQELSIRLPAVTLPPRATVCECGATKCGLPIHSTWCALAGKGRQ